MNQKKNYRRKQGHRQPYTKVEITGIKTSAKKAATTAKKAETKTTAAKKTTAKKEAQFKAVIIKIQILIKRT